MNKEWAVTDSTNAIFPALDLATIITVIVGYMGCSIFATINAPSLPFADENGK